VRAVLFENLRGPVAVQDVPDPEPAPGGVVVEVHSTGLCRSDWHAWAGHDTGVALPHVPGHELCGTIVATGTGVKRWQIGDRVTTPFVCGCGACAWCASGQAQVCPDQTQPGFTHWGSYAEYVALRAADTNLVRVPPDITDSAAASLGCRFATSYRALTGRAALREEEWLTVVGAGGVGLSAVMIGVALGARVIAVDTNAGALALATSLGAEHVVAATPGPASSTVAAAVHDLTAGGSHVALDAVGSDGTCSDSILSLRRRGRHVQVGLLPSVDGLPQVPMERVIAWELDLLGSHGMASADYPALLDLVRDGTLAPQDLVDRVVGLEEAARLLPLLGSGSPVGMTMADPRVA
jgi:alcohol dehydrogenase